MWGGEPGGPSDVREDGPAPMMPRRAADGRLGQVYWARYWASDRQPAGFAGAGGAGFETVFRTPDCRVSSLKKMKAEMSRMSV